MPDPVIVSRLPFCTSTSALSKPTGASLNVNVTREVSVALIFVSESEIETVGATVSLTVILNDPVAKLADESVAVQVTIVVPKLYVSPERWLQTMAGAEPLVAGAGKVSTSSVAETLNVTVAPAGATDGTVIFPGRERVGMTTSEIITVKVCDPVFPAASVALHVISFVELRAK